MINGREPTPELQGSRKKPYEIKDEEKDDKEEKEEEKKSKKDKQSKEIRKGFMKLANIIQGMIDKA